MIKMRVISALLCASLLVAVLAQPGVQGNVGYARPNLVPPAPPALPMMDGGDSYDHQNYQNLKGHHSTNSQAEDIEE